ncbi:hypothetical protein Heshes_03920 [Alicyclobacillus hesperidum]|uniref:Uncharacterized protein n=1 Tax=Alicyclobacillus hesperidum TaxID=89784 RepID=A0AA37U107_9BACL|nr:hypothetical protein Heshes_03920 [Alicyclobacillus hesperidum]
MHNEDWSLRDDMIWCVICHQLRDSKHAESEMHTCFRLMPSGMYRFGVCSLHQGDADEDVSR